MLGAASASTTMPRCRRSAVSACGSRRCRQPPSISAGAGPDGSGACRCWSRGPCLSAVPGPADRRPARAVPGLVRAQGFPPGELGRLLALMHELDHNGLASCWRRCARRALARWARASEAGGQGGLWRRRCRANVTKCARTVLQSATSCSGWVQAGQIRVQAPKVQAPNGSKPQTESKPQAVPTSCFSRRHELLRNFRPMSR